MIFAEVVPASQLNIDLRRDNMMDLHEVSRRF